MESEKTDKAIRLKLQTPSKSSKNKKHNRGGKRPGSGRHKIEDRRRASTFSAKESLCIKYSTDGTWQDGLKQIQKMIKKSIEADL